jgi:hypothetical protein
MRVEAERFGVATLICCCGLAAKRARINNSRFGESRKGDIEEHNV